MPSESERLDPTFVITMLRGRGHSSFQGGEKNRTNGEKSGIVENSFFKFMSGKKIYGIGIIFFELPEKK
jgi:hypothetical protein